MPTFFENTQKLVDEAARIAQIPGDILARLQKPDKVLEFEVPVADKKLQGWRVQHNNAPGPYKGGIRFHQESNLDEVKALASLMTWKTSLMGLPYGGAKGAVKVDSRSLSSQELEELSRGYVRAIWREIGPEKDIPAPDVGTSPQILDWMTDEYSKLAGKWTPSAFTGKSLEKGGSQGREVATGFGGYVILREYLRGGLKEYMDANIDNFKTLSVNPTVAIQGFGNVGSNIAEILFNHGFRIAAVSDSKGALYEKDGIDIKKLLEIKEEKGLIDRATCYAFAPHELPCDHLTNEELLELEVDILIPAALENQITKDNAEKIKAKVVLEMANGPSTKEAEEILTSRGVEIIPDILANGGGVVGSYFEWVQNLAPLENLEKYETQFKSWLGNEVWSELAREVTSLTGLKQWSEDEVLKKIDEKLTEAFKRVVETKKQYNTTWRLASYIRAINRVAEAIKKPHMAVRT